MDAATGAVIHEEEVKELHKWGRGAAGGAGTTQLERCFLGSFSRKDGTTGWRMLAASSDSSVALLQQSEVVWVREESLSGASRPQGHVMDPVAALLCFRARLRV